MKFDRLVNSILNEANLISKPTFKVGDLVWYTERDSLGRYKTNENVNQGIITQIDTRHARYVITKNSDSLEDEGYGTVYVTFKAADEGKLKSRKPSKPLRSATTGKRYKSDKDEFEAFKAGEEMDFDY